MRALAAIAMVLFAAGGEARGDLLRLRGDALGRAESPVGLLVLEGDSRVRPWLRAEAVVWLGTGDGTDGDVLTIALRARDPEGRGEARIGRIVVAAGAIHPVQLDGAAGRLRLPAAFAIEGWGGMPVAAGAERRAWDWAAGTRLSRRFGEVGAVGVAFGERRDHGRLQYREFGADAFVTPLAWLDVGGRVAVGVVHDPGVSEAVLSAGARVGEWRFELTGVERVASRLLPATSLFTVLGDVAARRLFATAKWRAAPRLDVDVSTGVSERDGDAGLSASARARLRLDDRGLGWTSVELRRDELGDEGWTGGRIALVVPLPRRIAMSAEFELAMPDEARGRGELWPWGIVAARWKPSDAWEIAAAVEGGATPEYVSRVDGLLRVSRAWSVP